MKLGKILLIAACTAATSLTAATVDLPKYGFSIDAIDADPGAAPAAPLVTLFPANDGFAPNINVNIQPYPGPIKDYAGLSKSQFAQMKWSVVEEHFIGDAEWAVEYKGTMGQNDLHFVARAISKGGKVYLVTGTAKESQWATFGPQLRKHLDSFKVK